MNYILACITTEQDLQAIHTVVEMAKMRIMIFQYKTILMRM